MLKRVVADMNLYYLDIESGQLTTFKAHCPIVSNTVNLVLVRTAKNNYFSLCTN